MDDIYSQGEFERNSIVELPEGFAKSLGDKLYSWLGSIWRSVHKGDGMVRGLQAARGVRLAQLYMDILEAAKLQDRNGMPVFHRELWHPVFIRRSERDTAQENMLYIGMDAEIGPQPQGSDYGEGTVLKMGRLARFENYVTYPLGGGIVSMPQYIVDNIINPEVSMKYGEDFEYRNGSIIFPKDNDPLLADSPFEKYDVPDKSGNPEDSDVECVLWASDVLMDRNYIADHLSYPLGARSPSSDIVKRILNAAWSSTASGLTPELIKTLMAAMLNIPVIQGEHETVLSIDDAEEDGVPYRRVRTDRGDYKVSGKATIRKDVFPGAKLVRGDLLDESLRIYPFLSGVRGEMVHHGGGSSSGSESSDPEIEITYPSCPFSVPIEQDIASVVVPRDMLRVRTNYGVYAMWFASTVKRSEDGNPEHLYFDVGGTDADVSAFWDGVWKSAEEKGVRMSDLIGNERDTVSPAAFFLRHLVGANTIFAVVDRSQLDSDSMMRDPMFFGMLSSVVPSAIRLFVFEHTAVGSDDVANLGESAEGTSVYASVSAPEDVWNGSSDGVTARFVRLPPPRTRGRKEEA